MNGNSFVEFILRSPFHGMMSGNTLLITVAGRKTGRLFTTPVNYYQDGSTLWVMTRRDRKWWRNVQSSEDITLRLRGKQVRAVAEAILDESAVAAQIGEYVRRLPLSAKSLGIRIERDQPETADLQRAAQEWLMVRMKLH